MDQLFQATVHFPLGLISATSNELFITENYSEKNFGNAENQTRGSDWEA
jgi:hypothetical protein